MILDSVFGGLTLSVLISRILILVIAFSVHEFSHAITADRFGDNTPRANGRLTLNPLSHLDPMGSLLLLVAGFGWAKPVPVNPAALQRRSSAALMWVSLAGPLSNLLMAILAAIPFRLGWLSLSNAFGSGNRVFPSPAQFTFEFIAINLALMLFNLIPLAPLDGEKVAAYLLPPSVARVVETIQPYGPVILLAALFVLPAFGLDVFGAIMRPAMEALYRLLLG